MMTAFFGSTTAFNATGVKSTGMVRSHSSATLSDPVFFFSHLGPAATA